MKQMTSNLVTPIVILRLKLRIWKNMGLSLLSLIKYITDILSLKTVQFLGLEYLSTIQ